MSSQFYSLNTINVASPTSLKPTLLLVGLLPKPTVYAHNWPSLAIGFVQFSCSVGFSLILILHCLTFYYSVRVLAVIIKFSRVLAVIIKFSRSSDYKNRSSTLHDNCLFLLFLPFMDLVRSPLNGKWSFCICGTWLFSFLSDWVVHSSLLYHYF